MSPSKKKIVSRLSVAFLLLCGALLTSCSLLPEPEGEIQKFTLTPLSAIELPPKHMMGAIVIDQPIVYAPLDQSRVAIKPTTLTIDYISGIEWADRLSTLIHENLIQSFQNSGKFHSVGRLNSGLDAQYLLSVDVRKFEKSKEFCCVEVEYFVQLTHLPTRNTTRRQVFSAKLPLQHQDEASLMTSLNDANKQVVGEIISWVVKT